MTYVLDVPGKIKGKGRPRFTVQDGYARAYTPKDTAVYENYIKTLFLEKYGAVQTEMAVEIGIEAFMAVPKSTSKKKRQLMLAGKMYPAKKPDIDNIIKAVLDGLNGTAYADDKQVVSLYTEKRYAESEYLRIKVFTECE